MEDSMEFVPAIKATCADGMRMGFFGEQRKPCFMSQVAQGAKEGLREQVMMDELNLNAGVQFSCVAGERKDVPVVGVGWTKTWKLENIAFVGMGMLWMVFFF